MALLAVLLLGTQLEARWHALGHLGESLRRPHEATLQTPHDDGPCAICALFAGGAAFAPNDRAALPVDVAQAGVPTFLVPRPAADAPTFYLSRAPPPLL